jgi:hypothetical protein
MICPRCAEPLTTNMTECPDCKRPIPLNEFTSSPLPMIDIPPPVIPEPLPQFITCPFCKEEVRAQAIKCKHCHAMLIEQKSDTVALLLALVLGPVGLWYKGQWAAGFAWIASAFVAVLAVGIYAILLAPFLWLFMAAHAYGAAEKL